MAARPPSGANVGVERGCWGEDVAAEFLRLRGYEIVERNSHPCPRDRRLEVDIIAYDPRLDAMRFVEVKQHAAHSPRERRLRSVDARKKALLRRACRVWLARNRWSGGYGFDVVEVYGEPGARRRVEIDYIERVDLFPERGRFVNWAD